MPSDSFRRQHVALLASAQQLASAIARGDPAVDAARIRGLLSTLAGQLRIHLAMEDKALYPELLRHRDLAIRRIAQQFVDEMGGLAAAFGAFDQRWTGPAIAKDPSGFADGARRILAALKTRIQREDRELYPLLDR